MNLGGMGQMMGAVPGGFQQGQIANNQIDQQHLQLIDQKAKQVGMQAYFRALQGMFNPQQGAPSQQAPMPGQPSVAGPQMSSQAMPGPQMGSPAPMALNNGQPMRGADGGMMPPDMGMQSQPASGVQPGGSPDGRQSPPAIPSGGQQDMSWRSIAMALKQQNPGVDDLALAHAVDKFMPMMNQQAQAEWRNIRSDVMLEIAKANAGARTGAAQIRADGTVDAAGVRAGGQVESAGIRADATTTAATTRAGATTDAATIRADEQRAGREQRDAQFQQREKRLQDGLQLRADTAWTRLDQQKQALEQRVRQGDRKQAVIELRAVIDAQRDLARTKINAMNMNVAGSVKDKKKFIEDIDAQHRAEIEKLKGLATQTPNMIDQGVETGRSVEDKPVAAPTAKPKPAASAAPAASSAQPVPQAFAADPDGTTYQKDGKTWVKRGEQLVLENGG